MALWIRIYWSINRVIISCESWFNISILDVIISKISVIVIISVKILLNFDRVGDKVTVGYEIVKLFWRWSPLKEIQMCLDAWIYWIFSEF